MLGLSAGLFNIPLEAFLQHRSDPKMVGVNIAANVVSPANDFANLAPGKITFRIGGLITGVLGVLVQPWKLLADPTLYIYNWLIIS